VSDEAFYTPAAHGSIACRAAIGYDGGMIESQPVKDAVETLHSRIVAIRDSL
jgi:hypothetical protein